MDGVVAAESDLRDLTFGRWPMFTSPECAHIGLAAEPAS
jgi:hypothetical protein